MKTIFLDAKKIFDFLVERSEELETAILCKPEEVKIAAYDQSLYEALGSINDKKKVNVNRLVKFLEVVDVMSYREKFGKRNILKDNRVEEIKNENNRN